MTQTTLPISPDLYWFVLAIAGALLAAILPKPAKSRHAPLKQAKAQMGLKAMNSGLYRTSPD